MFATWACRGGFRWGNYKTSGDVESRDAVWEELNRRWLEDRSIRINLLREQHERPHDSGRGQPGSAYTLQQKSCLRSFQWTLWRTSDH